MTLLPDQVLAFVDRLSMAHSVEVRPPFLDHRLIEFAATLPGALKIQNGREKHLLKEAVRGLIPQSVIDRRKEGFVLPMDYWILHNLRAKVEATLAPERLAAHGLIRPEKVRAILDAHYARAGESWAADLEPDDVPALVGEILRRRGVVSLVRLGEEHLESTRRWLTASPTLREQIDCLAAPSAGENEAYWRSRWADKSREDYAIVDENSIHVGNCGLSDIDPKRGKAQLWIYVGNERVMALAAARSGCCSPEHSTPSSWKGSICACSPPIRAHMRFIGGLGSSRRDV